MSLTTLYLFDNFRWQPYFVQKIRKKYCEQFQSKILGEKTNRQMYGGSFIGPSVAGSKNERGPE